MVLDQEGKRVLVQHADLDTNEYYLEIRDGQLSKTFHLPPSISQLAPQGYSAKFIVGETEAIMLNGERQILEPLSTQDKKFE